MYSGFSKDIIFAEKEVQGTDINNTAISLLSKTIANDLNNDLVKSEVKNLIVKKDFYANSLNLLDTSVKYKGKESLVDVNFKKTINGLNDEKFDHSQSAATLNDLISYVGDSSNLILDPDLDTYYLMDATIYAIPQLINRISEINTFIDTNSKNLASLSAKDNMKLNSLLEIIRTIDLVRLKGDIDTSLKEDANFYGSNNLLQKDVKELVASFDHSLNSYLDILQKINFSEKFTEVDLNQARSKTNISLLTVHLKSINVLKEMLNTRVENIKSTRTNSLGTGVLAVLIALFISFLITKTIRLDLSKLISKLNSSASDVDSTSKANMEISTELSSAVMEQASSVQEISSTTEEISQMTQRNNENVKVSMTATSETVQTVLKANNLMTELRSIVEEIKLGNDKIIERSNLNSTNFESIIGIMKTIEDKTKVINDIVFQTKLLSFNASVEAARAGEQGKGFAVVAQEIGSLANMSGKAAQEISNLLDTSLKRVRELTFEADAEIKKVVSYSTSNINLAVEKVYSCQNTNELILGNSEKVTELISDVVTASEEQTKGVIEITKAIGSFDVVTERNSQLANELNNSAKELSEKSYELKEVINSLISMAGDKASS